jgi:hypothetical protein
VPGVAALKHAGEAFPARSARRPAPAQLEIGHLEVAVRAEKKDVEDAGRGTVLPDLGRSVAADQAGLAEQPRDAGGRQAQELVRIAVDLGCGGVCRQGGARGLSPRRRIGRGRTPGGGL